MASGWVQEIRMGTQSTAQNQGLTGKQISALEMLAGCPDGCPESVLRANGFAIGLLGKLIRALAPLIALGKQVNQMVHLKLG
jgi:hypothetical protein